MPMEFDKLLVTGVERGASDLHLKANAPVILRIHGRLVPQGDLGVITAEDMDAIAHRCLTERMYSQLMDGREVDSAYAVPNFGRFRVNMFLALGSVRAVLRSIPSKKPKFEELGLPEVLEQLSMERRGLLLVTGITGSGKSTTLASMIDHVNRLQSRHVITIEDPIEYLHQDEVCVVTQREIGVDCQTFAAGLRGALRQDPDVILVGEMRDLETIEIAILAAETGHLVMSTLHTLDATETITRVISAFPEHARTQARLILANIIKGIVSQRLVPRADGRGMVPAVEVMVSTGLIKECIMMPERTHEIRDAIARGYTTYGMQTFDQSLMALWRENLISFEEALAQSTNPDDFALKARGISSTSDSRWEDFDKDGEASEEPIKVDRF